MQVEIYGDLLCPWCYIGKRRVAAALEELPGRDGVEVVWRSYELGQENRVPGPTAAEELGEMWGDRAQARLAYIQTLGQAEGLALNLHLARPVTTFDAHRLTHLGTERGLADQVLERLLYGYHTEGRNIADPEVLAQLGVEAGLAAEEVREMLAGDAHAAGVRADERRAAEQGVGGVPSMVVDGRAPVSGVQAATDLRRLLQEALSERSVAAPAPQTEQAR
jgi:predicted DsbA family dithiol-disulfide isomerase